jgi:hypothetical protein
MLGNRRAQGNGRWRGSCSAPVMYRPAVARLAVLLTLITGSGPSCARHEVLEAPISAPKAPVVMACPLGVPHTLIELVETERGADVRFTTSDQRLTDLRTRVRHQAEVRGPGQHIGIGHLGQHGLDHDHGMRLWQLPPHEATAEDAPEGSVLHVAALAPEQRVELVAQLKARVARLDGRFCW